MAGPYKEAARRLYEIAQSQQGFFTTKQATRAGFAEKTHSYHVKVGNWIREHRSGSIVVFIGWPIFPRRSALI